MNFAKFFLSVSLVFSLSTYGYSIDKDPEKSGGIKEEIKEYITHHLKDSHSFGVASYTKENGEKVYIEIPLPAILYDNGFKFFMSSDFKHGKKVVSSNETHYRMYYDKNRIYKTDSEGTFIYDDSNKLINEKPIDFSITKNVVVMIFTAIFMLWLFISLAKSYKTNKGISKGMGRFFEPIVLYVRDEIARPNIGKNYKKYMSFLLTIFFFVLFLNLLGLTPI